MSVKFIQAMALGCVLQGCASHQAVNSLVENQQDVQSTLAVQSSELQRQSDRIERMEVLQRALNHLLSELAVHVEMAHAPSEAALTPPQAEVPPRPKAPKPKLQTVDRSGKVLLGRLEWVWLDAIEQTLEAEVNTGMRNNLLYVSEFQVFERDGKDWVRFELVDSDASQEAPVVRLTKYAGSGGAIDKRPSIKTPVRMGSLVEEAEFLLTPGEKPSEVVVLGRNFLRDIAVVDVAQKHIQSKFKPKPL